MVWRDLYDGSGMIAAKVCLCGGESDMFDLGELFERGDEVGAFGKGRMDIE